MPLSIWIHPTAQPGLGGTLPPRVVTVPNLGEGITFGRAQGVTVELPFPAISGHHVRVFPREGLLYLEDLKSTNGTWLGDRRLAPHEPVPIAIGEIFRVASVQIRIEGTADESGQDSTFSDGNESFARRLVADLFSASPPAEPTGLAIESGPDTGKKLALLVTGRRYVVGRGLACDWVLTDEDMSREHAEFTRTHEGIRVRDMESKNGLYIGEQKVVGEALLHDGDLLRMGCTSFLVQDPEDRYLRQMEQVDGQNALPATAEPGISTAEVSPADAPMAAPKIRRPKRSHLPLYATAVASMIFFGILALSLMLILGYWK